MQIFRDIEAEQKQIADMRLKLIRENRNWGVRLAQSQQNPGAARQYAAWHARSRTAYLRLLKSVNSSILKFTLVAPSTAQPLASIKVDAEMAAFDSDVPAHVPPDATADAGAQSESQLRVAARAMYYGTRSPDCAE